MAQVLATEDRYLADFHTLEARLKPGEAEWLHQIRRRAVSHFTELGFPTVRRGNEKWKYTSVVPIAKANFAYPFDFNSAEVSPDSIRQLAPWDDSWVSLVFINGRYSAALSTGPVKNNGALVMNLADAVASDPDVVENNLAKYATLDDDAFASLNTAFVHDGAFVHVPDGDSSPPPLHLLFVSTDGSQPTVSHPRVLVVAGRHSKLTMVESYVSLSSSDHFTNAVAEIVLGDGAEVEHYRLLMDNPDAFHVGITRVHQGQDSTFSSTSLAKGAGLARNDLTVLLDAPGSSCVLRGLYMTSGTQHIDNYINIDHAKPHTTSRLYYRGILDGKSRAVFGGTVLVRPDAQKADAQQSDKNLILSQEAEVDSKPSLLIYADDVKCSHGATAGHVDEDDLLYMRSRGLDLETARRLLVRGFAGEIIQTVRIQALQAFLEGTFLGALSDSDSRGTS